MRKETVKYIKKDLLGLYQVLRAVSYNAFYNYRVNITRVRSASALAFLVYRVKFLPEAAELDDESKLNEAVLTKNGKPVKIKAKPKYFRGSPPPSGAGAHLN